MVVLKPLLKKIILCAFALAAIISAGFVLYIAYDTHSTSVNFQEYEPKSLPTGIAITSRSLDVWSSKTSFLSHTKQLTFHLSSSRPSSISETSGAKGAPFVYQCDYGVTDATCTTAETPNHQQYRLTTVYQDTLAGQPFEQTVAWLKGGTYIWIMLDGDPVHLYSQDEWSHVIDSFVPVHYSHIAIKQYAPGP